jgi:hypothetical protein
MYMAYGIDLTTSTLYPFDLTTHKLRRQRRYR